MRLILTLLLFISTLAVVRGEPGPGGLYHQLVPEVPLEAQGAALGHLFQHEDRQLKASNSLSSRLGRGWKAAMGHFLPQGQKKALPYRLESQADFQGHAADLASQTTATLIASRVLKAETKRVDASTDKLLSIAEGLRKGELGRTPPVAKPALRRTSSGGANLEHRLVRRGLGLGGGGGGWAKFKCALGCFGPSHLADPAGATGSMIGRLGGHHGQGFKVLKDQKEGTQLWALNKQGNHLLQTLEEKAYKANNENAMLKGQLQQSRKARADARLSVAQAFEGRVTKLTRSESAPARLQSYERPPFGRRAQ